MKAAGAGALARGAVAAATALLAGGCLPSPEHHCDESAAMACGASGACVDGYCAFADSACPSGLRYGDGAGARSGACAGGSGPVDAAVDAPADHGFGLGLDGPALVTAPIERSFNTCAPVVAGPAGRVVDYDRGAMVVATLPGVGDFEPGRLVIVWQTSSAANGAITVGDQAPSTTALVGRWQVSRVVAAERGRLTLADDLAFAPAAGAQVCRVPELTTVDIRSAMVDGVLQPIDVRPAPWNGAAGGLVAFYASDTVTISGAGTSISASSHGFRGGAGTTTAGATADCQELSGPTANGGGAHRGEGPFSDYYAAGDGAPEAFGRGNAASGGGGGDCLDAGGGGGAGGVAGGEGGYQATAAHTGSGLGGAPIVADPRTQLLMGGGGGGGEGNDGQAGAGGPGGGAVLIRAARLACAGSNGIRASGGVGLSSMAGASIGDDGAGGGGAGGTIDVEASSIDGCLFNAPGGGGGDTRSAPGQPGITRGPGGGGGGGRVLVRAAEQTGVAYIVSGGAPGQADRPSGNTGGATAGAAGIRCGDMVVSPGEACDDGNLTAGDGCDQCVAE